MYQAAILPNSSSRLQAFLQKRQQPSENPMPRFTLVVVLFMAAFAAIGFRLFWVMVLSHNAHNTDNKGVYSLLERADIVDRNGEVIATNLITFSLYARPHQLIDGEKAAEKLSKLFPDLNKQVLQKKLSSKKPFVWLKRNLTPRQQERINALGLVGIHFQKEQKRIYPHEKLMAHVVGYTNVDGVGLSGIERKFQDVLQEKKDPLRLSLDLRVQHIVRDALIKGMQEFRAKKASGMVMDVNTGEMIAMVSLPDFDPHKPSNNDAIFNTNTLGIYEMGSIFKIFAFAMALDSKKVTLEQGFDASQPMSFGKFTIKDYQGKNRWLSVPEVFMYSSNIGTVKMAMKVGTEGQKKFFDKLGFLKPLKTEIGENGVPMAPREWHDINTATISYGYGMAVSPLQVLNGVAAMVNGGILRSPTLLLNNNKNKEETRVISEATSEKLRRLLHLTVKYGSGTKGNAPGYLVGGKTGSANKKDDHSNKYVAKDKHRSIFVAAFPMHDPKYISFVMLDEPHGTAKTCGFSTGGWTSGPITKEIIEKAAPLLGVLPVDESSPKIQAAMRLNISPEGSAHALR